MINQPKTLLLRGRPVANPFAGVGGLMRLFSSHPPLEKRVRRLRVMAPSELFAA